MSSDQIVYWALLGIVGGAAGVALAVAGWLLMSHLALIREFDQFKGQASADFATPEDVKEAVAAALAPLSKELEGYAKAQRLQGRLLERIALKMHVPAVDVDDDR